MTSKARRALVPALRFPEFLDAGEWEEKSLSALGQTISGLSGKSADDFGSGSPFVTYKQVFDNAWIDFTKCGRVRIASGERQNELHHGDILFTTSSETPEEVGYASVVLSSPSEPVYLNSFCFSFRPDCLQTIVPEFARYLFHSPIYRKSITVLAQGSTRFNISKNAFLKLILPIPIKQEQQKIADCLSSVDELITLEARKIDALKAHKKGLMQHLFPAEDETLPKLRFPEFQDAGEWEEKVLGEIGKIVTGKTPSTTDKSLWGGEIQFVTPTDMTEEKYQTKTQRTVVNSPSLAILPPKTVMFTCIASIGKMALSVLPCVTNQQINSVLPNKGFENEFVYYALLKASSQIKSKLASTTLPIINKTEFSQIPIFIASKDEQRKIADCLSSIDDLITLEAQKLNALKAHKKGLLQQLFPSLDEVR